VLHISSLSVQNTLHVLEISTNPPPLLRWRSWEVGGVFCKMIAMIATPPEYRTLMRCFCGDHF
jgi:hypothetical protein